jgi:hypothetical protein
MNFKDDELDRILSSPEPELVPSSGFTQSVMQAVRLESQAPPPIAFPWKRALPGIVALFTALVFLFLALHRPDAAAPVSLPVAALLTPLSNANLNSFLLAAAGSIAGLLFTRRLMSH